MVVFRLSALHAIKVPPVKGLFQAEVPSIGGGPPSHYRPIQANGGKCVARRVDLLDMLQLILGGSKWGRGP